MLCAPTSVSPCGVVGRHRQREVAFIAAVMQRQRAADLRPVSVKLAPLNTVLSA